METQKLPMDNSLLCDIFLDREFGDTNFGGEDLFAILESLEGLNGIPPPTNEAVVVSSTPKQNEKNSRLVSQKSTSSSAPQDSETEIEASPKSKRQKLATTSPEDPNPDGQQRISHISVERNRRKQMNEHLSVLRSLMPCFYVKRVSLSYHC